MEGFADSKMFNRIIKVCSIENERIIENSYNRFAYKYLEYDNLFEIEYDGEQKFVIKLTHTLSRGFNTSNLTEKITRIRFRNSLEEYHNMTGINLNDCSFIILAYLYCDIIATAKEQIKNQVETSHYFEHSSYIDFFPYIMDKKQNDIIKDAKAKKSVGYIKNSIWLRIKVMLDVEKKRSKVYEDFKKCKETKEKNRIMFIKHLGMNYASEFIDDFCCKLALICLTDLAYQEIRIMSKNINNSKKKLNALEKFIKEVSIESVIDEIMKNNDSEDDIDDSGFDCDDVYDKSLQYLRNMDYKDYLNTNHWKHFRSETIKFYKSCRLCNKENCLHVHHNNYKNRGRETFNDVIVLCSECHAKFHDK